MDLKTEVRHGEKKIMMRHFQFIKMFFCVFSILATLKLSLPEKIKSILWNEIKTKLKFAAML